jgi:hypothetical protein
MGKEWYINGWGHDNMEYWLPARAGCQCSILYTTRQCRRTKTRPRPGDLDSETLAAVAGARSDHGLLSQC